MVPNLYCQNSLKSNNGLSRIIYISLNGLYGGYLKAIAFILAGNVEYRNWPIHGRKSAICIKLEFCDCIVKMNHKNHNCCQKQDINDLNG